MYGTKIKKTGPSENEDSVSKELKTFPTLLLCLKFSPLIILLRNIIFNVRILRFTVWISVVFTSILHKHYYVIA